MMVELNSAKGRGPFPDGEPEFWFVEAVPYTVELVRYFQGRSKSEAVKLVLGKLITDLELGEDAAVDLVRDVCLTTSRRLEVH